MKTRISFVSRSIIAVLCGVCLVAGPASSHAKGGKPNKHPNKVHKEKGHKTDGDDVIVLRSSGISAATVRAMLTDMGVDRSGYQSLPPGIRKNLARGKPLPPGIAKRYVPTPLLPRLPVRHGHEWRVVGRDLALVAIGTEVVADILLDVF